MQNSPYFMRDLSGDKIGQIMDFNVASHKNRSRSLFEFGVFLSAVLIYIATLALSA